MLGTTTLLTIDIASVPLVWVVPLALYLATFIVAFGTRSATVADWSQRLVAPLAVLSALALTVPGPVIGTVVLVSATFAVVAMVFHHRLAASRPDAIRPDRLLRVDERRGCAWWRCQRRPGPAAAPGSRRIPAGRGTRGAGGRPTVGVPAAASKDAGFAGGDPGWGAWSHHADTGPVRGANRRPGCRDRRRRRLGRVARRTQQVGHGGRRDAPGWPARRRIPGRRRGSHPPRALSPPVRSPSMPASWWGRLLPTTSSNARARPGSRSAATTTASRHSTPDADSCRRTHRSAGPTTSPTSSTPSGRAEWGQGAQERDVRRGRPTPPADPAGQDAGMPATCSSGTPASPWGHPAEEHR